MANRFTLHSLSMKQTTLAVLTTLLFFQLSIAQTPCLGGFANGYPCDQIQLQSQLTLSQLNADGDGNDIWGWTDPQTGKEYALMGLENGTAFVDISNPQSPILLGNLPTHTFNSLWRDMKVVNNHAYIVSEAPNHGMQVFDLTRLRNVPNPPATFTDDAHLLFGSFGKSHNIVANEETEFVYLSGTGGYGSGGLTAIDVSQPTNPQIVGNYGSDGYSHDAQCVVYRGPDTEYIGQEICIGLNEWKMVVLDYTDKDNPERISTESYPDYGYVHQGWLTDDHRYLLVNDETDESSSQGTRTYIFDLIDLDNPNYLGFYQHSTPSIDHNLYIKGNYAYLANYRSGLRIMELSDLANNNLIPTAFFDVYPANDAIAYTGAWSNYPYFKSGNIIVSSIDEGLFVVKPNFPHYVLAHASRSVQTVTAGQTQQFTFDYNEYAGFNELVNLSIENVPSDLQVSFSSNTITNNGQITVVVEANSNAVTAKHQLILRGESNNSNTVERLAFGVIVEGGTASCANDLVVANSGVSIPSDLYQAAETIISNGRVAANDAVTFRAGESITLQAGFVAENGSDFLAEIGVCSNNSINVTKEKERTDKATTRAIIAPKDKLNIAPNPAIDITQIQIELTDNEQVAMYLYDLNGKRIQQIQPMQKLVAGVHQFELSTLHLRPGLYFIGVQMNDKQLRQKLVVMR